MELLELFGENGPKRLTDIVTGDETWLHFYETPSKQDNMVWLSDGEPRPEVCKPSFRSRKRMCTVFFNYREVLVVNFLPEGATITGAYYATVVLPKLAAALLEQRPKVGCSRTLLHHDNASPHKSAAVLNYLQENKIQLVPHPPYSPDLAPLDFWLFPQLKEKLSGTKFQRIQDLAKAVYSELKSIPPSEYRHAFEKWLERLRLCVQVEGGYVEALRHE